MKIKVALILLFALSVPTLSACQSVSAKDIVPTETTQLTAVEVTVANKNEIKNNYIYSGKVEPINEVSVFSNITGTIENVNYEIGENVKKDEVLFSIDTSDIENNINVSKAAVMSAEANINLSKTTLELVNGAEVSAKIEESTASLKKAKLAYDDSSDTLNEMKALYAQDAISKDNLDKTQLAFTQAEITYNQAKNSFDIITNQMTSENIKKAQASLKVAEASKVSAEANLKINEKKYEDSFVKSPIDGIVTACNIKEGTLLSQNVTPFTITDMKKVKVKVFVSEQIINSLTVSQKVTVKVSANSDNQIEGTISTINPKAQDNSTYEVTIELDNKDNKLKPGMFAEVSFTKNQSSNTIVVSKSSVITKNDETYVFIEDNGVAKKVNVTLGIDNENTVEVVDGLEEGMNVITKGQSYLSDGQQVEIKTLEEE